jgi:hypothetical protein
VLNTFALQFISEKMPRKPEPLGNQEIIHFPQITPILSSLLFHSIGRPLNSPGPEMAYHPGEAHSTGLPYIPGNFRAIRRVK